MDLFEGARTIALRRDLDAMSMYYEERSSQVRRSHIKLVKPARIGLCFLIHGIILSDCEYFAINFLAKLKNESSDNCDTVLQIGGRLPQNYITRNSRLKGKWGPEESSSNLPFQLIRGNTFWMQVMLTDTCFLIAVNGFHFAEYEYRLPYKWLTAVDVRGDVSDILIDIFFVKEYPMRVCASQVSILPCKYKFSKLNSHSEHTMPLKWLRIDVPSKFLKYKDVPQDHMKLPFYGRLPPQVYLIDGHYLRIEGRVRLMPQSFSIALQCGVHIWPQPTVSLLFNPCFLRDSRAKVGKAIITRSAFINREWVNRDVSRLHTDLGPGKAFVIVIACRKNCYEVFVNKKLLLAFKYRMNPADIDVVNIRGDVKIWNIVVESEPKSTL